MQKTKLSGTPFDVTPVGMGVLTIGWTQLDLGLEEGAEVVSYALDKGINFLDTAEYYRTYHYIKEALKGGKHSPIIVSKSLTSTYDGMMNAIESARKELNRDVIEIFLLHEVRNDPDLKNRAGAIDALCDAKAKGYVTSIGLSTHYVDVARECADVKDFDVLFPLINYKSLGIRNGKTSGECKDMAYEIKRNSENGKGVFAMKAFGGGNLVEDYVKALDYVTSLEGIQSTMLGFGKKEEIDIAVDYFEGKLKKDYTPDVSEKKIRIDVGDCESCGACIKFCPNKAIAFNSDGIAEVNHKLCITCGYCAPVCPVRAILLF